MSLKPASDSLKKKKKFCCVSVDIYKWCYEKYSSAITQKKTFNNIIELITKYQLGSTFYLEIF